MFVSFLLFLNIHSVCHLDLTTMFTAGLCQHKPSPQGSPRNRAVICQWKKRKVDLIPDIVRCWVVFTDVSGIEERGRRNLKKVWIYLTTAQYNIETLCTSVFIKRKCSNCSNRVSLIKNVGTLFHIYGLQ